MFDKLKKKIKKNKIENNSTCRSCGVKLKFNIIPKEKNKLLMLVNSELYYSFCENCKKIEIFITETFMKKIYDHLKISAKEN